MSLAQFFRKITIINTLYPCIKKYIYVCMHETNISLHLCCYCCCSKRWNILCRANVGRRYLCNNLKYNEINADSFTVAQVAHTVSWHSDICMSQRCQRYRYIYLHGNSWMMFVWMNANKIICPWKFCTQTNAIIMILLRKCRQKRDWWENSNKNSFSIYLWYFRYSCIFTYTCT